MTIDERLEFLLQSSKSLHADLQELHAFMRQQADENRRRREREAKLRRAFFSGIRTLLRGLDDEGEAPSGNGQPE